MHLLKLGIVIILPCYGACRLHSNTNNYRRGIFYMTIKQCKKQTYRPTNKPKQTIIHTINK